MQALTDKTRQSALSMFDANLAQGISQMVTFCIETQEYGLPIAHVQEGRSLACADNGGWRTACLLWYATVARKLYSSAGWAYSHGVAAIVQSE